MKIIILDGYTTNPGDLSWDWLAEYGEYSVYDFTKPDETAMRIAGCEIVLSNKTVLNAELIGGAEKLRYIGLLSTGYNVVDIEAAARREIPVTNIPDYASQAVAQMTFAHILELGSRVGAHTTAVKEGKWAASRDFCFWNAPLMELNGKTIGIVGFGKIGSAVAVLAQAFGMRVLFFSPSLKQPPEGSGYLQVSLDELLRNSDIVTMHCPLTPATDKMANRSFFEKMKPNAFFINTSRGGVVDETALAEALDTGRIAGAGVDVLSSEPPKPDNPLLRCDKCNITPHIAWAAFETRQRLMNMCRENLRAFFEGRYINVVNGVAAYR